MARHISSGLVQPGLNFVAAHNETHRAVVGLESTKPHYDGPEWDSAGLEEVLNRYFATTVSTLAAAVDVTEKAIVLYDTKHITLGNAGSGLKIFAHKNAGGAIGGTPSSPGATLEQAMVEAWGTVCIELLTLLKNHMANIGGSWHATLDAFNSLGTLPSSILTKADLCEWTILLRSVYEAHRGYGSGTQHTTADSTNTIAAAPPTGQDDWDGILAVLVEVADELEDHVEDGNFHNAVMSVTPTVAAFPSAVSTAFGRANTYKATHNTHCADTGATGHAAADNTNTLSASNATTVATFVALAEEIRTKQPAHFRNAPTSLAMRGV